VRQKQEIAGKAAKQRRLKAQILDARRSLALPHCGRQSALETMTKMLEEVGEVVPLRAALELYGIAKALPL
jgi:hypothetical protein